MATSYVHELSEELLQRAVGRILAIGSPEKVILFGSRARQEAGPDSDLDLLIIDPAAADWELWDRYHEAITELLGFDLHLDLHLRTPEDVASWREVPNHFLTTVVREGHVLFQRPVDVIREGPPPKTHLDHVRSWWRMGERDLRRAERELAAGEDTLAICFWAQQAVEKYLKTFLALEHSAIRKTHGLTELKRMISRSRRRRIDRRIARLTRFAQNSRYADEEQPTDEFARLAVSLARGVRQLVLEELPEGVDSSQR